MRGSLCIKRGFLSSCELFERHVLHGLLEGRTGPVGDLEMDVFLGRVPRGKPERRLLLLNLGAVEDDIERGGGHEDEVGHGRARGQGRQRL